MKKIVSLFAIIAILSSFMVMPVNADLVHKENYDAFTESDNPTVVSSWKAYSSTATGASFENGDLKIEKTASTSPIYDFRTTTNGQNMTLLFDMKQAIAGGIGGYFHAGGNKRFSTGRVVANPTANEWYSHMFRVRDDATLGTKVADLYIKGPFSNETEKNAASWSFRSTLTNPSDSSVPAGIRFNMASDSYLGQTIWVDNFEVHQDLYISDLKLKTKYESDGVSVENEIKSITDISVDNPTKPLSLDAEIEFYNADFAPGNDFKQPVSCEPMLVLFDKNEKILDCVIGTMQINPLDINNKYLISIPDIRTYANKISKVQVLFWDSILNMQQVVGAFELK